ncbi:MAG: flagellar basal body rod protein FlgC [Acidobacteriia bacterium]|jgi:flagellar basal-body rod protein FlgC|nr:flagellar basal body rod protein FlgC [Terriglobia bacterium]
MGIFSMLEVSGAALGAERQRAEVVATNMANAETTRTPEGGPYHRKEVVFRSSGTLPFRLMLAGFHTPPAGLLPAVRVEQVVDDPTPAVMRYQPGHPDANKDGYVAYPAINPIQEMVDLMGAVRSYQLNASAVTASKQMIQQAVDLLK